MFLKTNFLKPLLISAVVSTLAVGQVSAQCIDAYMTGFDEYQSGQKTGKSSFRINELLVICFKTRSAGFVSIFDAPSKGAFEQLFPNSLTHAGGETHTAVQAGKLYCLGGRDTFPMYHPPDEGTGEGKISIILTREESAQLAEDDYAIPGQKVNRNTMELHLNNHARSNNTCTERDVKYLRYQVTN